MQSRLFLKFSVHHDCSHSLVSEESTDILDTMYIHHRQALHKKCYAGVALCMYYMPFYLTTDVQVCMLEQCHELSEVQLLLIIHFP